MVDLKKLIAASADPARAENRVEYLLENTQFSTRLSRMDGAVAADFVNILSLSSFFYHFICRHPQFMDEVGKPFSVDDLVADTFASVDAIKIFKYQQLLKITWMDFSGAFDYVLVLQSLSALADFIVEQTLKLAIPADDLQVVNRHLAGFGLGKLGAGELNFSSDIDLIFVCSNTADIDMDIAEYQMVLQDSIRTLSNQLENRDANGFLYRVDLKLRPWGRSGPLVMTVDETENYYEASSEAWERFAWLRARPIVGSRALADDMQRRLHPFIYRRSLSSDDLDRFVEIKNEMSKVRRRKGYWNVKVGEGGIRDLEFFIQMLQMVNAHAAANLQLPGTLKVLSGLNKNGLVTDMEMAEITRSYLFLRRLENHLQMVDEQQTHELPNEWEKRLVIARSLCMNGGSDAEILDNFETELFANRAIARTYFERLLPDT